MKIYEKNLELINPSNYYQYRYYPTIYNNAWKNLYISKISSLSKREDVDFFYNQKDGFDNLICCQISSWDYEHFGIRMGAIIIFSNGETEKAQKSLKELLVKCLSCLKKKNIEFVSIRINGDNLSAIHLLEGLGFKYYETIVWATRSCENLENIDTDIRLMSEEDIDQICDIASKNTFQRSHFHCDKRFPKEKVDSLHVKWVKTAWESDDYISVFEMNDKIIGFFIFGIDSSLSIATGYKYGRMKNLALDKEYRGNGFGEKLFQETMIMMKQMGVEIIDSGYSIKNHLSAKIHVKNSFLPVYEEVTFHMWPNLIEKI